MSFYYYLNLLDFANYLCYYNYSANEAKKQLKFAKIYPRKLFVQKGRPI